MKLFLLTSLAMFAFAANSLLSRMAFVDQAIDPLSFTLIQIFAGAALLALLVKPRVSEIKQIVNIRNNKMSALSVVGLSTYAYAFSWAYVGMDTGMGALILFATIQLVLNIIAQFTGAKNNSTDLNRYISGLYGLGYFVIAWAVCAGF